MRWFFAAWLLPTLVQAAGITARLNRDETTLTDPVVLTLTIEGTMYGEPALPKLDKLEITPRGQSTQMQFINGNMSSQVTYTYVLTPTDIGNFVIGSARASIDGRTYESKPLVLKVTGKRSAGPGDDQPAFVTAEVSSPSPYVGEQVVYTFRFYRRVQVQNGSVKLPDMDGFEVQNLGEQQDYNTTLGGRQYLVTEVKRALFAERPGTVTLPAATLTADIQVGGRRQSRDPFDQIFGNRVATEPRTYRSDEITLTVKPLPPAPAGYTGLVGSFTLQATLSRTALTVGDSASLALVVEGAGNVKQLTEPPLPPLAGVKLYDEKPEITVAPSGGKLFARAVYKKALVPTTPGTLVVGPLELPYFDPSTGAYAVARAPSLELVVSPGTAPEETSLLQSPAPAAVKQAVVLGDDLVPSHARAALWTHDELRLLDGFLFGGMLLPPLCFFGFVLYGRRRAESERRGSYGHRRRARTQAERMLEQAGTALSGGDKKQAVTLMSHAFREWLGERLLVPGLALTADEARERLRAAKGSLVHRVHAAIVHLEAAQFGGAAVDLGTLRTELLELVRLLDKEA